jgi:NADH dehydrogenase
MALPGRGHVQVRIEDVSDEHVIVATLRGHVLAGIVRFSAVDLAGGVRFEVLTCDTAANALDWMALSLGAARVQDANWTRVVQNVAKLAGGEASDISVDGRRLHGEERTNVERWIQNIIRRQQTSQHRGQTTLSADAR